MIEEPEGFVEIPAAVAYRELASAEAERLYGSVALLLGEAPPAEQVVLDAWRRTWRAYWRGQILGDAEEVLYRLGVRAGLNRLARSRDLRGYQPPTTAPDRLVTAAGILGTLSPQQRAGVILAIWGGLDLRLAGIATALSGGRVAEAAFAARQEFREATGAPPPATATCHEVGHLLSGQLDGEIGPESQRRVDEHLAGCAVCQQAREAFQEFDALIKGIEAPRPSESPLDAALAVPQSGPRPARGLRRLLQLATGPAVLALILVAGVFLFGDCGEPAIKTGAGRTSDLIYAREAGATIVLDSGTGREAGRLGMGVLSRNGDQLYGTRQGCGGTRDASAVWVSDTGTLQTTDVGCVEGRLRAVGVDVDRGRVYLADEAANWERLVVFDLSARRLDGAELRPEGIERPFAPDFAVVTDDRSLMFSVGLPVGGEPGVVVLLTDLGLPELAAITRIPSLGGPRIALLPDSSSRSAWVYDIDGGRVSEVSPFREDVARSVSLSATGGAQASLPVAGLIAQHGALAARPSGRDLQIATEGGRAASSGGPLFAIVAEGGIAAVTLDRFEVERHINPEKQYLAIATSTDGRALYAIEADGTYVVLDAATGSPLLRRARVAGKEIVQVNAGE